MLASLHMNENYNLNSKKMQVSVLVTIPNRIPFFYCNKHAYRGINTSNHKNKTIVYLLEFWPREIGHREKFYGIIPSDAAIGIYP